MNRNGEYTKLRLHAHITMRSKGRQGRDRRETERVSTLLTDKISGVKGDRKRGDRECERARRKNRWDQ